MLTAMPTEPLSGGFIVYLITHVPDGCNGAVSIGTKLLGSAANFIRHLSFPSSNQLAVYCYGVHRLHCKMRAKLNLKKMPNWQKFHGQSNNTQNQWLGPKASRSTVLTV
jgi:hypothetical protein